MIQNPRGFQKKASIQGQEQHFFQPKAERVRPNYPEAVGLGERSTQDPGIAVNTLRISSPKNRNITPTQNEHSVVTPEICRAARKPFEDRKLTGSREEIVKTLEEGQTQLRKASEKTNKRLDKVVEEQNHCKRDRGCLHQDLNRSFNVYQNMNPQPQGHVLDNPYQQDIKPDALLENKARFSSQYQDGDNMSYSEKEALKQLPETLSWLKFSGKGEYDHMKLIDYIDGLFIDLPSIPEYWITARLNK
ncbi:hypothetical protein O181_049356 [Austropuccinia psidii MF-1]|uniref:Uncharacterized protein n=1 Tax=Austropuccinia psidii MF-1 TaxID=1389203 RepID=A0A9Q3DS88_9BASI|nr:hypothetical protein [Austropuccinia psidii MF-1]